MTASDRLAGAEMISARAKELAMESGVVISDCVWDIGQDLSHPYAHRLDLSTETKAARLYFPDVELTSVGNETRKKRTDDRLRGAIAQLITILRGPTYGTSLP